ncbi:MAG: carboxy-S-adenosyl-L-methionine synthase CmoA [Pseudomonadota bacterium]
MKKDTLFAQQKDPVPAFEFNEQVVSVFDDMLERSVPLYRESISRQAQLALEYYRQGTGIYDMGCSHGRLGMMICEVFKEKPFFMVGVDSSGPMLDAYRAKLASTSWKGRVSLVCGLAEEVTVQAASVVIVNLTLQFIRPERRDRFIRAIYQGLVPGGILILTEKVIHEDPVLSGLEQAFYARLKMENGYSQLEISQKREALEGVLIPETLEKHQDRLSQAGFSNCDVWLKWFNFASMICIKQQASHGSSIQGRE